MIIKNFPDQFIYAQINSKTTGAGLTSGVTFNYDAGTYGAGSNTPTHRGGGLWRVKLSQEETNVDSFGYQFLHTDALTVGGTHFTEDISESPPDNLTDN